MRIKRSDPPFEQNYKHYPGTVSSPRSSRRTLEDIVHGLSARGVDQSIFQRETDPVFGEMLSYTSTYKGQDVTTRIGLNRETGMPWVQNAGRNLNRAYAVTGLLAGQQYQSPLDVLAGAFGQRETTPSNWLAQRGFSNVNLAGTSAQRWDYYRSGFIVSNTQYPSQRADILEQFRTAPEYEGARSSYSFWTQENPSLIATDQSGMAFNLRQSFAMMGNIYTEKPYKRRKILGGLQESGDLSYGIGSQNVMPRVRAPFSMPGDVVPGEGNLAIERMYLNPAGIAEGEFVARRHFVSTVGRWNQLRVGEEQAGAFTPGAIFSGRNLRQVEQVIGKRLPNYVAAQLESGDYEGGVLRNAQFRFYGATTTAKDWGTKPGIRQTNEPVYATALPEDVRASLRLQAGEMPRAFGYGNLMDTGDITPLALSSYAAEMGIAGYGGFQRDISEYIRRTRGADARISDYIGIKTGRFTGVINDPSVVIERARERFLGRMAYGERETWMRRSELEQYGEFGESGFVSKTQSAPADVSQFDQPIGVGGTMIQRPMVQVLEERANELYKVKVGSWYADMVRMERFANVHTRSRMNLNLEHATTLSASNPSAGRAIANIVRAGGYTPWQRTLQQAAIASRSQQPLSTLSGMSGAGTLDLSSPELDLKSIMAGLDDPNMSPGDRARAAMTQIGKISGKRFLTYKAGDQQLVFGPARAMRAALTSRGDEEDALIQNMSSRFYDLISKVASGQATGTPYAADEEALSAMQAMQEYTGSGSFQKKAMGLEMGTIGGMGISVAGMPGNAIIASGRHLARETGIPYEKLAAMAQSGEFTMAVARYPFMHTGAASVNARVMLQEELKASGLEWAKNMPNLGSNMAIGQGIAEYLQGDFDVDRYIGLASHRMVGGKLAGAAGEVMPQQEMATASAAMVESERIKRGQKIDERRDIQAWAQSIRGMPTVYQPGEMGAVLNKFNESLASRFSIGTAYNQFQRRLTRYASQATSEMSSYLSQQGLSAQTIQQQFVNPTYNMGFGTVAHYAAQSRVDLKGAGQAGFEKFSNMMRSLDISAGTKGKPGYYDSGSKEWKQYDSEQVMARDVLQTYMGYGADSEDYGNIIAPAIARTLLPGSTIAGLLKQDPTGGALQSRYAALTDIVRQAGATGELDAKAFLGQLGYGGRGPTNLLEALVGRTGGDISDMSAFGRTMSAMTMTRHMRQRFDKEGNPLPRKGAYPMGMLPSAAGAGVSAEALTMALQKNDVEGLRAWEPGQLPHGGEIASLIQQGLGGGVNVRAMQEYVGSLAQRAAPVYGGIGSGGAPPSGGGGTGSGGGGDDGEPPIPFMPEMPSPSGGQSNYGYQIAASGGGGFGNFRTTIRGSDITALRVARARLGAQVTPEMAASYGLSSSAVGQPLSASFAGMVSGFAGLNAQQQRNAGRAISDVQKGLDAEQRYIRSVRENPTGYYGPQQAKAYEILTGEKPVGAAIPTSTFLPDDEGLREQMYEAQALVKTLPSAGRAAPHFTMQKALAIRSGLPTLKAAAGGGLGPYADISDEGYNKSLDKLSTAMERHLKVVDGLSTTYDRVSKAVSDYEKAVGTQDSAQIALAKQALGPGGIGSAREFLQNIGGRIGELRETADTRRAQLRGRVESEEGDEAIRRRYAFGGTRSDWRRFQSELRAMREGTGSEFDAGLNVFGMNLRSPRLIGAVGGIGSTIRGALSPNAIWGMHAIMGSVVNPLAQRMEQYQQSVLASDAAQMQGGLLNYDSLMGGAGGSLLRRRALLSNSSLGLGYAMNTTWGSFMEGAAGTGLGTGLGGVLASILGPAAGGGALAGLIPALSGLAVPIGAGIAALGAGSYLQGAGTQYREIGQYQNNPNLLNNFTGLGGQLGWAAGFVGRAIPNLISNGGRLPQNELDEMDRLRNAGLLSAFQTDISSGRLGNVSIRDLRQNPTMQNLSRLYGEGAVIGGAFRNLQDYGPQIGLDADQVTQLYQGWSQYNRNQIMTIDDLRGQSRLYRYGLQDMPGQLATSALQAHGINPNINPSLVSQRAQQYSQQILTAEAQGQDIYALVGQQSEMLAIQNAFNPQRAAAGLGEISQLRAGQLAANPFRTSVYQNASELSARVNLASGQLTSQLSPWLNTLESMAANPNIPANVVQQMISQGGAGIELAQRAMAFGGTAQRGAELIQKFGEMTPEQFTLAQRMAYGDQYAWSYMASRGQAPSNLQTINMQTGMGRYYENLSARDISDLRTNDPYHLFNLSNAEAAMGERGWENQIRVLSRAQDTEQYRTSQLMTNMQRAMTMGGGTIGANGMIVGGSNADVVGYAASLGYTWNTGNGMTAWQVEDAMTGISRQRQDYSMSLQARQLQMAEQQFAVNNQQWYQRFGLQQERVTANDRQWGESWSLSMARAGYDETRQREEIGINRERQLVSREWGREDLAYSRDRSELEFGWQMQDFDRNIRYARGRQKRDLMREQERSTIRYAMESGQRDKEEERFEERAKWADEDFERQKENFEKSMDFRRQELELARKHHEEDMGFTRREMEMSRQHYEQDRGFQQQQLQWQQESFQKEMQWLQQTRILEDQQRLQERQYWDLQQQTQQRLAVSAQETQVKIWAYQDAIKLSGDNAQRANGQIQLLANTMNGLYQRIVSGTWGTGSGSGTGSGGSGTGTGTGGRAVRSAYMVGGYVPSMMAGGDTGMGLKSQSAGLFELHAGEYVVPQNGSLVLKGNSDEQNALLRRMVELLSEIARNPAIVNAVINANGPVRGRDVLSAYDMADARLT